MMSIFDKVLAQLSGFDFWFAMILSIIGLAGCYYLGETIPEKSKKVKSQFSLIGALVLIGLLEITIHSFFFSPPSTFSKDVAGILVLQIEGDDAKNSLQRDLVRTLNTELSEETAGLNITVRAENKMVAEDMGLAPAHQQARQLGKKSQAQLVIWGTQVGEQKFHPRITIVNDQPRTLTFGERTLSAQSLGEVNLSPESVSHPVHVIHFVIGHALFEHKDFAAALARFKTILASPVASGIELNDSRYFAGNCHYYLAQSSREPASHLQQAIAYYDTVLGLYTERNFPKAWAVVQNDLGNAYVDLPTGDRSANLQKAIAAYEAALRVYTEKEFPAGWAMSQNSLGVAYFRLPTGDHAENLHKAIAAYEAALRVYTEKDYPVDWAKTQNNLGTAYSDMETGDRQENLQRAIAAYEAALRIRTEKDFPADWAMTQNNLGNAYWALSADGESENLQKAIAAYEAALRIRTEKDFPLKWAMTQNNIGIAYASLTTGDKQQNLQKSIAAFAGALRVFTQENFPGEWASTQNNLGNAYVELAADADGANLRQAITCFENALQIWTATAFPEEHKMAVENLKDAKSQLRKLAKN